MRRNIVLYILFALVLLPPLMFLPQFYYEEGDIPRIVLGKWLITAGTIILVIRNLRKGKAILYTNSPVLISFFAFFCINSISLLMASHRYYAIQQVSDLFLLLLLFMLVININKNEIPLLLNVILFSCGLLSVLAIAQYIGIWRVNWAMVPWEKGFGKRAYSTIGNPNFFASILILVLPLSIIFFLTETNIRQKLFYGIISIFTYVALLFTNSWGGWMGFIGSMIGLVIAINRTRIHLIKWNVVLLWIGLVISTSLFLLDKGKKVIGEPIAAKARFLLWETAVHMIKEKPILGFGANNFMVFSNKYLSKFELSPRYDTIWENRVDFILRNPGRPHNEYLAILVDTGIVGFAVFVWFIASIFKQLSGGSVMQTGVLCGVIAFIIDSFVNFPLRTPTAAITFIIILGLGMRRDKIKIKLLTRPNKVVSLLFICGLSVLFVLSGRPLLSGYYFTKGVAIERKDEKEAIKFYKKSLKFGVVSHLVYSKLGNNYRLINDYENAIKSFKEAQKLQPYHEVIHYKLGVLYAEVGNLDNAITSFKRAIEFEPRYGLAYGYLADLLMEENKVSEALLILRKAVQLIPFEPGIHNDLGIALIKSGDIEKAKKEFNTVVALTGGLVGRYNLWLSETNSKTGYVGAAAFEVLSSQIIVGRKELQRGNLVNAEKIYNKILYTHPDFPDALVDLATIKEIGGEIRVSKTLLTKAFLVSPTNNIKKRLLNILVKTGDFNKAESLMTESNLYYSKNMFDQAEKSLLKAIEVNPTLAQAYYNLGVLYTSIKKEPAKAIYYLKKFVELVPTHPDVPKVITVIKKQQELMKI